MTIDNEPQRKFPEWEEDNDTFDSDNDYGTSWDEIDRWLEQVKQTEGVEPVSLHEEIERIYSSAIATFDDLFAQLAAFHSNDASQDAGATDSRSMNHPQAISDMQQRAAIAETLQYETNHLENVFSQLRDLSSSHIHCSADAEKLMAAIELDLANIPTEATMQNQIDSHELQERRWRHIRRQLNIESAKLEDLQQAFDSIAAAFTDRLGEQKLAIQQLTEQLECSTAGSPQKGHDEAESLMGTF